MFVQDQRVRLWLHYSWEMAVYRDELSDIAAVKEKLEIIDVARRQRMTWGEIAMHIGYAGPDSDWSKVGKTLHNWYRHHSTREAVEDRSARGDGALTALEHAERQFELIDDAAEALGADEFNAQMARDNAPWA